MHRVLPKLEERARTQAPLLLHHSPHGECELRMRMQCSPAAAEPEHAACHVLLLARLFHSCFDSKALRQFPSAPPFLPSVAALFLHSPIELGTAAVTQQ